MGEVDTALVECIRKATELTAVVAGDALENLREDIAICFSEDIKPCRHARLCLVGGQMLEVSRIYGRMFIEYAGGSFRCGFLSKTFYHRDLCLSFLCVRVHFTINH